MMLMVIYIRFSGTSCIYMCINVKTYQFKIQCKAFIALKLPGISPKNGLSILFSILLVACPILTFYLSLNSNHWRLDVITFQDPFFKIFAKQHPVFIISFHLPEIPPLPLG